MSRHICQRCPVTSQPQPDDEIIAELGYRLRVSRAGHLDRAILALFGDRMTSVKFLQDVGAGATDTGSLLVIFRVDQA